MQYLLLIYNNEKNWMELPDADAGALRDHYRSFTESIAKSGHYKGGNALQPTNTATTVRVRNGKRTATDSLLVRPLFRERRERAKQMLLQTSHRMCTANPS